MVKKGVYLSVFMHEIPVQIQQRLSTITLFVFAQQSLKGAKIAWNGIEKLLLNVLFPFSYYANLCWLTNWPLTLESSIFKSLKDFNGDKFNSEYYILRHLRTKVFAQTHSFRPVASALSKGNLVRKFLCSKFFEIHLCERQFQNVLLF